MKRLIQLFLFLTIFIGLLTGCSRIQFDSDKWKNWKESEAEPSLRWDMKDHLINEYNFTGMSTSEVIELLGEPELQTEEVFRYYLGHSGRGINTGFLILKVDKDTVTDIEIWQG